MLGVRRGFKSEGAFQMISRCKYLMGMLAVVTFSASVVTHSNAATLSVEGGVSETLSSQFSISAPGITAGSSQILVVGNNGGLKLDDTAKVTYEYIGKEASYTNITFDTGTPGGFFSTASGANVAHIVDPATAGFLDFSFKSIQGAGTAKNGGTMDASVRLAFLRVSDFVYYALFEDIAGPSGDRDFDDMVIKITVGAPGGSTGDVPLPAAVWLFGTGAAGVFLMRRRRHNSRA